jgi:hypothetical protein
LLDYLVQLRATAESSVGWQGGALSCEWLQLLVDKTQVFGGVVIMGALNFLLALCQVLFAALDCFVVINSLALCLLRLVNRHGVLLLLRILLLLLVLLRIVILILLSRLLVLRIVILLSGLLVL